VLALLVADEVTASILDAPLVAVVSFGGPKVGNTAFVLKNNGKVNFPTGPYHVTRLLPLRLLMELTIGLCSLMLLTVQTMANE
jgi:hypothetical protein